MNIPTERHRPHPLARVGLIAIMLFAAVILFKGRGQQNRQAPFTQKVFTPKGTEDFRFIIMGDSRPNGGAKDPAAQKEVFRDIIRLSNQQNADFAVNVGDLIAGYTKDPALLKREWDAYDEVCKLFTIPIVAVPGNHDIFDDQSLAMWRKRFGSLYFSWNHKSCHFIALNTEIKDEKGKITGKQLKWLKRDLARARKARRIYVMLHKPVWVVGPRIKPELNDLWFKDVHPLLVKHKVDTVFAGHDHEYTRYPTVDGVHYVVTGGAGAPLRGDPLDGSFYHFLNVDVKGNASQFAVVTEKGILPSDCVTSVGREALKNALKVEPLSDIGWFNRVTLKATIENVSSRTGTMVMKNDTKSSSWKLKENKTVLKPGESTDLSVRASFKDLLPVPSSLRVEMMDGDTRLYHWNISDDVFSDMIRPITNWNVIAPFGLDVADEAAKSAMTNNAFFSLSMPGWYGLLPCEEHIDFNASYTGKDGKPIKWQVVETEKSGMLRLRRRYPGTNFAISYAVSYIYSPRKGKYLVGFGSDDAIAVRLNGKEVWRSKTLRGLKPDSDAIKLSLNEGWNELGVKVLQAHGGWGFIVRVIKPDQELRFSATRD